MIAKYSRQFKIGIVALSSPSLGLHLQKVMAAVSFLQLSGFTLVIGESVFRRDGYMRSPNQQYRNVSIDTRANDLHAMFKDDSINLILNTTGGFNSNELLDFLDYDLIKGKPKFFVGYSDITAVNVALYAKTGIPVVSGCMLGDFVDHPDCFLELFRVLSGEELECRNPRSFVSVTRSAA